MDSNGEFLEDGDLVQFDRGEIKHWGIYDGGYIIHVTGEADTSGLSGTPDNIAECIAGLVGRVEAYVEKEKLRDVAKNDKFYKNNLLDSQYTPFSPAKIIKRARKKIGQKWVYYLLTSNCEHFASEMRYGFAISLQAVAGVAAAAVGVGIVAVGGSLTTLKNKK